MATIIEEETCTPPEILELAESECQDLLPQKSKHLLVSHSAAPRAKTTSYTPSLRNILLIADPQILGENDESWISRWDSDRFLQKTFWMAYWYVKPSTVIFLGDLMDEGSISSDEQYARYYERFKTIFHTETLLLNKTIYLPGDNDIGGENERITAEKIERYEKHFGLKPDIVQLENVQVIKINMILQSYPVIEKNDKLVKVGVSHMPVMARPSLISKQVLSDLQPHLIFSAHNHISGHFVSNAMTGELIFSESFLQNKHFYQWPSWRFQLSDLYPNEVLVPTCSYRMGVQNLAYGVVLIDKQKGNVACYNILWLPNRLVHLMLYVIITIVAILISIFAKKCLRTSGYNFRYKRII